MPSWIVSLLLVVVLACACAAARAQGTAQSRALAVVVVDQNGDPVQGATVLLTGRSVDVYAAKTDAGGRFEFAYVPPYGFVLTVAAEGFGGYRRAWAEGAWDGREVRVVLAPPALAERVTVTAARTETRLGETAASVVVIGPQELETTAALAADDVLRQVPGFQLFRRTGSRAANPTAQGVSLRGVGPSGASRAVVLYDGVPLNDPFGGWVYWGRVPREGLGRVEVLRGGASSLYGSGALGGVVQFVPREPSADAQLRLETSYGAQGTADASLYAGALRRGWSLSVAAQTFATGGYVPVSEGERGRVDTPAASRYAEGELYVGRKLTNGLRLFARPSHYGESRRNGTPQQFNRTHIRQLAAGAGLDVAGAGSFGLRAYASAQVFDQSFTSVNADRSSETLTRLQRVPAQGAGLSFQWARSFGSRQAVVAGFEVSEVRGASDELVYVAGRPSSLVGAGGRARTAGFYARDALRLSKRLVVTPGARFDRWRNYDARQTTRPLTGAGATSVVSFAGRGETAFSPQLSAVYALSDSVSLDATFSRAFRAPTLNELYRSFRVGNVFTLADENLRAERLTGGEAGLLFSRRGLAARANFFWTDVTRPVANVTLSATPALITRRRQNLGRTRARGFEAEIEKRFNSYWSLSAGYLAASARVASFPADASLEGNRVPQVARQQLNFQLRYATQARLNFALQGRAAGPQFEDDQNALRLGGFFTLDAFASRRLGRGLELFAAAENLTGRRYEVGRTPVLTLGPPAFVRVGLRLRLGGK